MSQTTYQDMVAAREGSLYTKDGLVSETLTASAALKYGLVLQRDDTADGLAKPMAALPAADDDAIVASLASAASDQTFEQADFTGATGAEEIIPAQRLSFEFNNHADWLATVAKVTYIGADGSEETEDLEIPANGNVTLYTKKAVSWTKAIFVPTQGGTNGTIKVGTDPTLNALNKDSFPGIGIYSPMHASYASTTEVAQYQTFRLIKKGFIWVVVEAAVSKGDPVWVRTVAAGADVRGQMRGSAAANFSQWHGAVFHTSQSSADGLAVVELK